MEFKYIIKGKMMIILLVILIGNILFFYKNLTDFENAYYEENGYAYADYVGYYNECISYVKQRSAEQYSDSVQEFYQNNITEDNKESLMAAVKQVHGQMSYIDTYNDEITTLLQKAEQLAKSSIYQDKTAFSYNNILKGRYDLKKLQNLKLELNSNTAVDHILRYQYAGAFIALIMVLIVSTFRYPSTGFSYIVKSTKNGRKMLALKRVGVIAVFSVMSAVFTYIPVMLISFVRYGGTESLGVLIQCNSQFARTPVVITFAAFFAYTILLLSAAGMIAGLAAWLFMLLFKENTAAVLAMIISAFIEMGLYAIHMNHMVLQFFKYVNIFSFLTPYDIIKKYNNWGIGTNIMTTRTLMTTGMIILLAVLSIANIYISAGLWGGIRIKSKFFSKLVLFIHRKTAYWPNWLKELKKTGLLQKGIYVFGVVILYAAASNFGVAGISDGTQIGMQDYYNAVQGDAYDKTDAYINDIEQWIEGARETLAALTAQRDMVAMQDISDRINEKETLLAEIYAQSERVRALRNQGIERAGVINIYKFENRYGIRMNTYYENFTVILFLAIVLVAGKTFLIERNNKMDVIIRSTLKGGKVFLFKKYISPLLLIESAAILVNIIQLVKVNQIYPLNSYELHTAIQSIPLFENCPIPLTVMQLEMVLILYRLLIYALMAVIASGLSMFFEESELYLFFIITMVPYILECVGIAALKSFSIVGFTVGIQNLISAETMGGFFVYVLIVIVLTMVATGKAVKKWKIS